MSISIVALGSGVTLQDAGRSGWRRFGVPQGGAMDTSSMAAANRLLGNRKGAPVLEIRQQGTRIEVLNDMWLALAGADSCAELESWTARLFRAGSKLTFSENRGGVFSYLAAPGGWLNERWFGSVSVDLRSKIGRPIISGVELQPMRSEPAFSDDRIRTRSLRWDDRINYLDSARLQILPGPQFNEFSKEACDTLVGSPWSISTLSDRTGVRLDGRAIESAPEIRSEPVMVGSFQVPDSGQPIVTMADGPTVGGYPKIAVLTDESLSLFAQCAPGTEVSFQWKEY